MGLLNEYSKSFISYSLNRAIAYVKDTCYKNHGYPLTHGYGQGNVYALVLIFLFFWSHFVL